MKRKHIITAACIALVLIVGGFIYQSQQQPVELELGLFVGSNWDVANANSYAIVDKAIEKFESTHPGVTVTYSSGILKEDYSEWLSRKLLGGDCPDVFMVLSNDFYKLADIGALKSLDELAKKDSSFAKEDYYQTVLESGVYKSRQYAMPYEVVPTLMFVNKTLLTKEGIKLPNTDWTWNDLFNICSQISRSNTDQQNPKFGTINYNWQEVVTTNGVSLFNKEGTQSYFNDSRVAEAVEFSKRIYDLNQGRKVTPEDFNNGNVVFMPLQFSDYRTYKTYPYKIKKFNKFQWDCITFPAGPSGGNVSELDTLLVGMSSQTKEEKLAWEFLKMLTYDEEIQQDIFRYSQGASVLKKVTDSEETSKILRENMPPDEHILNYKLLDKVIEEGALTHKFPKYQDAIVIAENEINAIMSSDGKRIDSSLKNIQRSATRFLTS